ncbi:hypothetical protein EPAKOI_002335 [Cupriavidus sp. H18C2]
MLTRHHSQGTALLACVAMLLLLMGGVSVAALHFLLAGRQLTSQPLDREIAFRAAEAALRRRHRRHCRATLPDRDHGRPAGLGHVAAHANRRAGSGA